MAYSMFDCPKLQNSKSLKFYPEEYDHHVSFRHKNLPPDFELTMENCHHPHLGKKSSLAMHKKCPIYVHNLPPVNDGDFHHKNHKKSRKKLVLNQLEETYWANWKPDCKTPVLKNPSPEIQVIKSAPVKRQQIPVFPEPEIVSEENLPQVFSVSQEIQTEDFIEVQEEVVSPIEEVIKSEEDIDNKFLRHTDSFILNIKKQQEEKESFDQPKCIRLYRKAGRSTSKNFVKGGSYPLKSCLKKDGSFSKKSSKFARPGSPMIVASSFSTKGKHRL